MKTLYKEKQEQKLKTPYKNIVGVENKLKVRGE